MSSVSPRSARSVILPVSAGNALEWYDIVLFGVMTPVIAPLFYPAHNSLVSLLLATGTFAITFVTRPIGAIVLGLISDRAGRKRALTLSMVLMTISTLAVCALPTYAQIGAVAPALLITARVVQGFAAGGEYGAATTLLAEQDPPRRGYFASWQFGSQGFTQCLAAFAGLLLAVSLDPAQRDAWGWRLPFVFGLLVGPAAIFVRRKLLDGKEFTQQPVKPAARDTGGRRTGLTVACCGLVVIATAVSYMTLFMPSFAMRELLLPAWISYAGPILGGAIQTLLAPVVGSISDRIGRLKPMTVGLAGLAIVAIPLFWLLTNHPSVLVFLAGQAVVSILASIYLGPFAAVLPEILPVRFRGTGTSVSYSLSVAVFGGWAPFVMTALPTLTHWKGSPSLYLVGCAVLSGITLLVVWRRGLVGGPLPAVDSEPALAQA